MIVVRVLLFCVAVHGHWLVPKLVGEVVFELFMERMLLWPGVLDFRTTVHGWQLSAGTAVVLVFWFVVDERPFVIGGHPFGVHDRRLGVDDRPFGVHRRLLRATVVRGSCYSGTLFEV